MKVTLGVELTSLLGAYQPGFHYSSGCWSTTIGAGPQNTYWFTDSAGNPTFNFGNLVAGVGERDYGSTQEHKYVFDIPGGAAGEDLIIEQLLGLTNNYNHNEVKYSLFPELFSGYNSNSFVSGLLIASGLELQASGGLVTIAPGWEDPVPISISIEGRYRAKAMYRQYRLLTIHWRPPEPSLPGGTAHGCRCLDRIEGLKGPASLMYGEGAVGGLIVLSGTSRS